MNNRLMTILGASIGVPGLLALGFLMRGGIWIVVSILVLGLLLFGGFLLFRWWSRQRQERAFKGTLEEGASAKPREVAALDERAKLDNLRKKFSEGLREYESRGKSLYSLPWYLLIGEPASGKTEAIRHCGVGFPPGLNEEMQGAGGTVNMNWWFTNHAVILDTAGRLVFPEVRAGETGEWKEFLRLLRKTRSTCPINGLFLTISADSLLKNTADQIEKKANRIAQQLDVIQRILDVRFPVYVLITKCDLLLGFREFFDGITDPALQHQMMGWSNPDPLDAPFRPELVDEHLNEVAQRLNRRRLALLSDPAPENPQERRTAEVDALYALPSSIARTIAPRLRKYLETIFVAGTWSSKPVFLRGIYFTSSMREGDAIDNDLAEVLGVDPKDLPAGRQWAADRAFFLTDLFKEKAFKEQGLVTRATNTSRMLRQRQLLIAGSAGIAGLVLILFAWLSMRDFKRNVGRELSAWETGTNYWTAGVWNPIVVPQSGATTLYRYRGEDPSGTEHKTILGLQMDFQRVAANPVRLGFVFRPLAWFVPSKGMDRGNAQKVLFERGVLLPLVQATRVRMVGGKQQAEMVDAAQQKAHFEALKSLIQLEAGIFSQSHKLDETTAQQYLRAWLNYTTGTTTAVDTNLVRLMVWTYTEGAGRKQWPPSGISGGNTLSNNTAIASGLNTYFAYAQRTQGNILKMLTHLDQTQSGMIAFYKKEQDWYDQVAATVKGTPAVLNHEELESVKVALDKQIAQGRDLGLFKGEAPTLSGSVSNLLTEAELSSKQALVPIYEVLPRTEKEGLFNEIRARLDSWQEAGVADQVRKTFSDAKKATDLDRALLAMADDKFAYQVRWALYQKAIRAMPPGTTPKVEELLGKEWEALKGFAESKAKIIEEAQKYKGSFHRESGEICAYLLAQAEKGFQEGIVREYIDGSQRLVKDFRNLTDEQVDLDKLKRADDLLGRMEKDLRRLDAVPEEKRETLKALAVMIPSTREGLVDKYIRGVQAGLKHYLHFPILAVDPTKRLTMQELADLSKFIRTWENDLNDVVFGGSTQVKSLRSQLAAWKPLVDALVGDNGVAATCEIGLAATQEKSTVFTYRGIALGGKAGGVNKDTTTERYVEFGKFAVSDELFIEVYKFRNDPATASRGPLAWGPILLITEDKKAKRSEDGRVWTISYPIRDASGTEEKAINLEVRFTKPLPELEKWPKP